MNAIVTIGSRSCATVLPNATPRIAVPRAGGEHRNECDECRNQHQRAGGGQEIQPIGQRVRRGLRDHRRFALHERHRLAVDHLVRARPVEVPHREAECLRRRRGCGPIHGSGTQAIAGLAAAQQRRDVGRRLHLRHAGEVSALADQHGDDQNAVGGIGAPHARTGIAASFRPARPFSSAKASLGFQNLSSTATEASENNAASVSVSSGPT